MRATVDLSPFLPHLESGVDIVTPGKRLAREITDSWVRHCGSQPPVVTTPRVTTVDSWLERAWLQAVEAGRLPLLRLLTPQQDLAVWQQLIRDDLEERLGFSLTHPRAAAQRAQAALNKLVSHGGNELSDLWSAFQYDEDSQIFSEWARRHRSRLDELGGISRYGAYQQLLSVSATERTSVGLFAVPELPPLTLRTLHHLAEVHLIEPRRHNHASNSGSIICHPR